MLRYPQAEHNLLVQTAKKRKAGFEATLIKHEPGMPRSEWKETLLSPGEGLGVQAGLPGAPSLAARYLGNRGGSVAMGGIRLYAAV